MKYASILLILALVLSSCGTAQPAAQVQETTYTLHAENFDEIYNFSGTISAIRETAVAAKVGGRIKSLNADIGDFVLNGTLLGSLAGSESSTQVSTSQLNQKNIEEAFTSQKIFLDKQVESAQKALELAQTQLNTASTSQQETVSTSEEQKKLAQKALDQAQTQLESVQNIAAQRLQSVYNNAESTIRSSLMVANAALSFSDTLLGVSPDKENANNDIEDNLGALNSNSLQKAEISLKTALDVKQTFKTIYDNSIENQALSFESWDGYLQQSLTMLNRVQTSLNDLYTVLGNSTTGGNLTETTLENYKTQNLTLGSNVEAAILNVSGNTKMGVKGLLLTRDEVKIQNQSEMNNAQAAVLQYEQSLNEIQASTTQNVSSSSGQASMSSKEVERAKSMLESVMAQRDYALQEFQRQIDLVRGNTRLTQVALGNTQIGAPFSGIITEKHAEVGQVIAAGQSVFSVADVSQYKLISDIPDTLIQSIHENMPVEIRLSESSQKFQGVIAKVYPKINQQTRTLPIEIHLLETPKNIKIGMFAEIEIRIPEAQSYFVPRSFVHFDYQGAFIVLEDGTKHNVEAKDLGEKMKIWFEGNMEGLTLKQPQ